MRWSEIHLKTLREKPSGAESPGHILLLRAGYIHNTGRGVYLYNSLFVRAIRKLKQLIRREIEAEGMREILMPMVQSKKLWEESGRWDKFEGLLLKMKGRDGRELCLGPTHEEIILDFVRAGSFSQKDLPFKLYQIQTKYRDEIRPRFGLMRAREFIMKDGYSFDLSAQAALQSYQKMSTAYHRIFKALGADFTVVEADSGAIGGSRSQEFHILAETGEDEILFSDKSAFAANKEVCPRFFPPAGDFNGDLKPLETIATPGVSSLSELRRFLGQNHQDMVKSLFFLLTEDREAEKPTATSAPGNKARACVILCAGDDTVSPFKLKKFLGLRQNPQLASPQRVKEWTGARLGSCGPWRLRQPLPIYADQKLKGRGNFITGANKDGFHVKNCHPGRDFEIKAYGDFCHAQAGDPGPEKGAVLKKSRGIEVGHIFYLSDLYSRMMGLSFQDVRGRKKFVEMGCYGLGVTRALQALVEQSHDKYGIVWPSCVAPFTVHICLIDPKSPLVLKAEKKLTSALRAQGLDFFIDDRMESPGVKFKDAELLGLPIRLSLGERDLKKNQVEIYLRRSGLKELIHCGDFPNRLESLLKSQTQ